jgi:DNA modification methylase
MAVKDQLITDDYAIYNGDCIEVMSQIPDNSIHLTVYSPPFAGLYQYSSDERDLSNNTYNDFMTHYKFVIDQKWRITMPGRFSAVHCMDVPFSNTGRGDASRNFPDDIIELHCSCDDPDCTASKWDRKIGACGHGKWEYVSRYDIWKEPLGVRNRTMMKSLAHQTIVEDATSSSNASSDYLIVFRKKGNNPIPVTHETGFQEYAGAEPMPQELESYRNWRGKQIENKWSHQIWRRYASSHWHDIRIDRVLPYRESRDQEDEKHVHPLQLDVIDRAVVLWTNPGEKVFTPFMGVGSEVYSAVVNGRKGIGAELKPAYYRQTIKNLAEAVKDKPKAVSFAQIGLTF